jgi:hypothetical protein
MFENLPPRQRPTEAGDTPRQRTLIALGAALAALPEPWRVLRDGGAPTDGGGLGASFVALHPERGIALVDLAPARPRTAVTPLRGALVKTGKPIFTAREPPIVAVLLSRDEIPNAVARVTEAFAELSPCRIRDDAWTEAASAALGAEYPGLTPVSRASRKISAAAEERRDAPAKPPPPRAEPGAARPSASAAPARPAPPRAPRAEAGRDEARDPATPRQVEPQFARGAAAATRPHTTNLAPRRDAGQDDDIPIHVEPRLSSPAASAPTPRATNLAATRDAGRDDDIPIRVEPRLSRPAASAPPPRAAARRDQQWEDETPLRAEPSLSRPAASATPPRAPRLAADPDDAWEAEPPSHRTRHRGGLGQSLLWLVAASLGVIAALVFLHPREAVQSLMPNAAPQASAPQPALATNQPAATPAPADTASPATGSAASPPPDLSRALVPPHAATILPSVPPRGVPAERRDALPTRAVGEAQLHAAPPTPPQHAPESITAAAKAAAARSKHEAKPEVAGTAKKIAKAAPEPSAAPREKRSAETKPPPRRTPEPAHAPAAATAARTTEPNTAHRAKEQRPAADTAASEPAASAVAKANTVTIDGTTYIEGREPHRLGTIGGGGEVAADAPRDTSASAPTPTQAPAATPQASRVPPPGPATQFSITPSGIVAPSGAVTPFGQH